MRSIVFINNQYYHIYNRGVDKQKVFKNGKDYERFLISLKEFNSIETLGNLRDYLKLKNHRLSLGKTLGLAYGKPLVEIVAYCLLPNHYHLIVKQIVSGGITAFLHRISTSYSMYFNKKYERSGRFFHGPFKGKLIDSDEYLIWLSAYIHVNPEIHKIDKANEYKYSSYEYYINKNYESLASGKEIILDNFKTLKDYQKYCQDLIPKWQEKKEMQKYALEIAVP